MNLALAEQPVGIAFRILFACLKALLIALVLIVAVLFVCQSRVAPVSVRLLTTYAMEYAVTHFKPYRVYFPEPYKMKLDKE